MALSFVVGGSAPRRGWEHKRSKRPHMTDLGPQGLVREIPLFQENEGWWNNEIWYFGQMIDINEEDDDNDDGIFRCINSFCLFLLFY